MLLVFARFMCASHSVCQCRLDLKKPARTRFAYQFIMLERLHKLKGELRHMATSAEFTAMDLSTTPEGLAFHEILFMEPFWVDMQQLMDVTRPIYSILRLVDREGCTMGLIYEFMDRIGESLQRSRLDPARYNFFPSHHHYFHFALFRLAAATRWYVTVASTWFGSQVGAYQALVAAAMG
ncbi:hypothetical protein O6H91_19G073700 [Diphasiastrum complanatum]|uniref:Uncharacterized protein n=1 Tax=Diphasiastrum complanatum TaxID=34168 RepID=A0ACC2AWK0_DIPCM|nr:hypothetical protein O6H91_19G073700 [Diphasiastrum complanatum]